MKSKKVLLVVEQTKKGMDRAFSVLKSPTKNYGDVEIISFPDFETLGKVITGARLELMNVISHKQPKSIQELSRFLKRDFKNVYQDVKLLSEFGLISLKESGRGRAAAPRVEFSEIIWAA